ncbi:hypothetical protein IJ847_00975 [Candidatus Saccharibacteria bacterium]|nr:hypothetical protein [Candidatus Saccharibacteria bacterium]
MENNFASQSYASHVGIELQKRNFINEAWLSSVVMVLENSSNDSQVMQRGAEMLDRISSIHAACLQTIQNPMQPISLEQAATKILDQNAKQWLIGALRTGGAANFEFDAPEIPERVSLSQYDNVRAECFLCIRERIMHYSEYEDKIATAIDESINTYDNNAANAYRAEAENWLSMYNRAGQTPVSIESDYMLFKLFAGADRPIFDILLDIRKAIEKGEWQSGSNSGLPSNLCANIVESMLQGIAFYAALRGDLIAGGALTGKEPKYAPDGRPVSDIVAEEANHTIWGKLSQAKEQLSAGNNDNLRGKLNTFVSDLKTFMKKPPTGSI